MATNSSPAPPSWFNSLLKILGYVLGFAAGLFARVSGALAIPDGSLSTSKIRFGSKISGMPIIAWIVIFVIMLGCVIVQIFGL